MRQSASPPPAEGGNKEEGSKVERAREERNRRGSEKERRVSEREGRDRAGSRSRERRRTTDSGKRLAINVQILSTLDVMLLNS